MKTHKAATAAPFKSQIRGLCLALCLGLGAGNSGLESFGLGFSTASAQTASAPAKKADASKSAPQDTGDDWGFTFPRFFANLDDIPKLPDNRVGLMGLINNERHANRHGPSYESGIFGMHGSLRPDIDYTYQNRFFINTDEGVGVYLYNDKKFYTGVSLYAREGRGKGQHGIYNGLGHIDTSGQIRAFAGYDFGFLDISASIGKDFSGTEGTTLDLKAGNVLPLTPKLFLTPEIGLTFANSTYMQGFYGVNALHSLNSGLPVYKAKSGLENANASASLIYVIDKKWAPFIRAEARYLYGSADKTPIYYRRMVAGVGIGISYLFD